LQFHICQEKKIKEIFKAGIPHKTDNEAKLYRIEAGKNLQVEIKAETSWNASHHLQVFLMTKMKAVNFHRKLFTVLHK